MVLQNTTFVIDEKIEKEFLHWIKTELAPAARGSEVYGDEPRFHLILANAEPGTKNFAFQLSSDNLDKAQEWLCEGEGSRLLAEFMRRFEGHAAHFSTFMAEIAIE